MTFADIRADLQMLRDPVCELCGKRLSWSLLQLHHIAGRFRGEEKMNAHVNLVFLCGACHRPGSLGYENQCALWWVQEARYGRRAMEEWRDSLGWRVPIRFPWEG